MLDNKNLFLRIDQLSLVAFAVCVMFTISYIDPTSFTVDESIFILSIVIIGGMRNLWGSVIASAFLVLLPEALRFVGMPTAIAANMRQIIYGGILIFMMFRYSKGLMAEKF